MFQNVKLIDNIILMFFKEQNISICPPMYYYLDFYHRLVNAPHFHDPLYIYTPPVINYTTETDVAENKREQCIQSVVQAKPALKIQQDQKIPSKKCIFSQNKKVHIISKKSKIRKINFVDKRNIIPNNINHILAFVQRKSKSQKIIQKIICRKKKQYQPYSAKVFYSYQTFVKNKLSVHVNSRALQIATTHLDSETDIFQLQEQLFYNKISRIAILYYLKNIAPLVTLHSKRLKNTCKRDHLYVQRYLLSFLKSLSYQQRPDEAN